jgi:hypothetical protein
MSLDEFLASVRQRMESTGCLASEAVDELFSPTLVDGAALFQMARAGAIHMCTQAMSRERERAVGRESHGHDHQPGMTQQEKVSNVLMALKYKTADGVLRSLWEFTKDDWNGLKADSAKIARGYRMRVKLCDVALKTLAAHGADRARDLPINVQRDLEEEAKKAW